MEELTNVTHLGANGTYLQAAEEFMNTALTRTPGTVLHRQVFVILRDQILRGVYKPGTLIPNEDGLCAEFEVSRITVRRAVSDLVSLGLLERRRGRGTYVASAIPTSRSSATLDVIETLRQNVVNTKVDVVRLQVASPPPEIATQLNIGEHARALEVIRIHRLRKTPVLLTESWLHDTHSKYITVKSLKEKTLAQKLGEHGVTFQRVAQEITAVIADMVTAKQLDAEVGSALVKITRVMYDEARQPVQHSTTYFVPDRSRLLMDILYSGSIITLESGAVHHDVNRL